MALLIHLKLPEKLNMMRTRGMTGSISLHVMKTAEAEILRMDDWDRRLANIY